VVFTADLLSFAIFLGLVGLVTPGPLPYKEVTLKKKTGHAKRDPFSERTTLQQQPEG
jgi:hypothetical protein